MKKLFFFVFVAMVAAFKGHAALFINNNTDCRVIVEIYAHDLNHGICGLHSVRLALEPGQAASFNNVASVNTALGWLNGQTATTTGGTSVWGWDGAVFNGAGGGGIGSPGSCFSTSTLSVPNACVPSANVTATWVRLAAIPFLNSILNRHP